MATNELRERYASAVHAHGLRRVRAATGLATETILRFSLGLRVQPGTVAQAEKQLGALETLTSPPPPPAAA